MFAQEPPPDFDDRVGVSPVNARNSWPKLGLVEVACAIGEVAPVDRSGGVDREHSGGEAVGAGQPLRSDADELLKPLISRYTVTATDPEDGANLTHVWAKEPAPGVPADQTNCGTFTPNFPAAHQAEWNHPNRATPASSTVAPMGRAAARTPAGSRSR
jgi:hypothetical protein